VTAGVAIGVRSIAVGLGTPMWGRLSDRLGARPVLMGTALAQAVATAGLAMGIIADVSPVLWVVLAGATGIALPPVSAVMRAAWSRGLTEDLRATAYALEAIVADIVFIGGPLLVAVLALTVGPLTALVVVAAASVVGSVAITAHPMLRDAPVKREEEHDWLGPLRDRTVARLLGVGFLAIGSITAIEIAIIAFADDHGDRNAAGVLIAVMSVGGLIGGLYWGSRRQPGTVAQQLSVLLAMMAVMYATLALAPGAIALGALLIATGLLLNPMMASQFRAMDEVAPERFVTESFAWLSAAGQAGAAAAGAAAGALVQHSPSRGFLLAAVMIALGAALMTAVRAPRPEATGKPEVAGIG